MVDLYNSIDDCLLIFMYGQLIRAEKAVATPQIYKHFLGKCHLSIKEMRNISIRKVGLQGEQKLQSIIKKNNKSLLLLVRCRHC